jgi:hypothetical protein
LIVTLILTSIVVVNHRKPKVLKALYEGTPIGKRLKYGYAISNIKYMQLERGMIFKKLENFKS